VSFYQLLIIAWKNKYISKKYSYYKVVNARNTDINLVLGNHYLVGRSLYNHMSTKRERRSCITKRADEKKEIKLLATNGKSE